MKKPQPKSEPQIAVRMRLEHPSAAEIEKWTRRMSDEGLVIDHANDHSIDAHGSRKQIEVALDVEISEKDSEPNIVRQPAIPSQEGAKRYVYIPRKPELF